MFDAVFDLATIAVALSLNACRVLAAFGYPGLVDTADRIGMCMLGSDDPLTLISQLLLIPDD